MAIDPTSSSAARVELQIRSLQGGLRTPGEEAQLRGNPPPEIAQEGPKTERDRQAREAVTQELKAKVSSDNALQAQQAKDQAQNPNQPSPLDVELEQAKIRQEADAARRARADDKGQELQAQRDVVRQADEQSLARERAIEEKRKQAELAAQAYEARVANQDRADEDAFARRQAAQQAQLNVSA